MCKGFRSGDRDWADRLWMPLRRRRQYPQRPFDRGFRFRPQHGLECAGQTIDREQALIGKWHDLVEGPRDDVRRGGAQQIEQTLGVLRHFSGRRLQGIVEFGEPPRAEVIEIPAQSGQRAVQQPFARQSAFLHEPDQHLCPTLVVPAVDDSQAVLALAIVFEQMPEFVVQQARVFQQFVAQGHVAIEA